ncbi:RNA methyltransferase [uncultured Veillonella sp.]|uniref:TrmH family RNA methyltransferase n=1 Tax=uncultured Veillonella sp. TaxID=159268 RepID=UPI0026392D15|nr:RNA methyltransferase [uncultured Veillonella sp.]
MELITSKDSRTLKFAQSLQKKKYRMIHDAYLAEGLRTVADMLPTGLVSHVLIKEDASLDVQNVAHEAEAKGAFVYVVSDPLFQLVENTVHGQGIIGIVKKSITNLNNFIEAELKRLGQGISKNNELNCTGQDHAPNPQGTAPLYVVLDEVQDPGNLGTIIRTAVAANVNAIFLTKGSVDPYNEKTVRSTMSAITKIPIIEGVTVEDMVEVKERLGITIYATALEEASSIYETSYALRNLIILGNEARGISAEWQALADKKITIPMYGPIESLNLSVAAALCFYAVREREINDV